MSRTHGGIKIFIEKGKLWAWLAKILTLPLVLFSVLSFIQIYFQQKPPAEPFMAHYLVILGVLLSGTKTFLNVYAVAFALGVVSFCTYIVLNEFNVSRRDILFLMWLTIPPFTVLFIKSL